MCERSAVSALSMIELRTGLRDFECGSAGVLSARHDQAKTRPCKCGLVQNLQNLVWCGEGGRSRGFMGHSIEGLCPPLVEHCVLLWPLPLSVRASMCAADRGEGHDLVIVLFAIFLPFSTACLPPAEVSVVAIGQQYKGRAPCPREDDALLVPFWLPPPHRQGVPCAGQSVSARFPMSSWDFPGPELLCFPAWRSLHVSEICVDLWVEASSKSVFREQMSPLAWRGPGNSARGTLRARMFPWSGCKRAWTWTFTKLSNIRCTVA